MFDRFRYALALRRENQRRLKRISFLFQGGTYIFWQDKICKRTKANRKAVGLLKSLFFSYHVSGKGIKKEGLVEAVVKTGTFKHAVLSGRYCYLVFKQQKDYLSFRKNYFENVSCFNYPAVHPLSCNDDLFYVVSPIAIGRVPKSEELPQVLRVLLKLFEEQRVVKKDENGILYYVQHNDPLPGNSMFDEKGNIFFIDLDGIASKPALSDFFNLICRTQGLPLLLEARRLLEKELRAAFSAHGVEYTEETYDLYLSKYAEAQLLKAKGGFHTGDLPYSIKWILDPVAKKEFPFTHEALDRLKIESPESGYNEDER